jgi:branched-chain amino acid transport system permease protein
MQFFLEVLVGGLLSGVMYSLVALGFVLIYKASGVFNFAQGAMVFFAALTFVAVQQRFGLPFWAVFLITLAVMVLLGVLTERVVLRRLVNQPQISLFMATIGLAFFIEGAAQLVQLWALGDLAPQPLNLGFQDEPFQSVLERFNIVISKFDAFAAAVAGVPVADDHQAALSVGIPLKYIWAIVWAVAGFVALVAGLMWGSRGGGVQFALTFVALKALPVLILGGFESIAGAIVGGLIIGAAEKLAEVYLGPLMNGGIEGWFAYVMALLFLLVRPEGLFGEKHIDRV